LHNIHENIAGIIEGTHDSATLFLHNINENIAGIIYLCFGYFCFKSNMARDGPNLIQHATGFLAMRGFLLHWICFCPSGTFCFLDDFVALASIRKHLPGLGHLKNI
jgi:hypothetical protein